MQLVSHTSVLLALFLALSSVYAASPADLVGSYASRVGGHEDMRIVKRGRDHFVSALESTGWSKESPLIECKEADLTKLFGEQDRKKVRASLCAPDGPFGLFLMKKGDRLKDRILDTDYFLFFAWMTGSIYRTSPGSSSTNVQSSQQRQTSPAQSDSALSMNPGAVDSAKRTITSGGFDGLRIGHSVSRASEFFGEGIVPYATSVPIERSIVCGVFKPQSNGSIAIHVRSGKIVAFDVLDQAYSTRSGIRAKDPATQARAILSKDPSFREFDGGNGGSDLFKTYVVGDSNPISLRVTVWKAEKGPFASKVFMISFGSTRELRMGRERCQ